MCVWIETSYSMRKETNAKTALSYRQKKLSVKRRRDATDADRIFLNAEPRHFFSADLLAPPLRGKKSRGEVGKMIMTRVHLSPPRTSLDATAKSDGARRAIDSHARVEATIYIRDARKKHAELLPKFPLQGVG